MRFRSKSKTSIIQIQISMTGTPGGRFVFLTSPGCVKRCIHGFSPRVDVTISVDKELRIEMSPDKS